MADIAYSALIDQAIASFDNIANKLKTKGVIGNSDTPFADNIDTGVYPVSEYPSLIESELFKVEGKVKTDLNSSLTSAGLIPYKNGESASSATITYESATATLVQAITAGGFYDAGATLKASIATTAVDFKGKAPHAGETDVFSIAGNDPTTSYYTITPEANHLLGSVKIAKGSHAVTLGDISLTEKTVTANNTIGSTGDSATAVLKKAEETISGGKFHFTLKTETTFSAKAAVSATSTFTEGYIDNVSVETGKSTNFAEEKTNTEYKVELDAASISGIDATANVTVASADADILSAVSAAEQQTIENALTGGSTIGKVETDHFADSYLIYQDSAAGSISIANAAVTPGYISSTHKDTAGNEQISVGNVDIEKHYYKVKKGSLGTNNTCTLEDGKDITGTLNLTNKTDGKYVTTFDINKNYTQPITSGYIKNDNFVASVSGSKTIEIGVGHVQITGGDTTFTPSGDLSTAIGTTAIEGGKSFTISTTTDISRTVTEGYIKNNTTDVSAAPELTGSATYWMKSGTISSVASLTATAVDTEDGKPAESGAEGEKVNLFVDTAPTSGDYYKIDATASASVTEGYVSGTESASDTKHLYIPKAKLKYVEALGENEASFVEVTSGGYIPSGLVAQIADITGTIDKASVAVAIESGNCLNTTSGYEITIATKTIDAGYISNNEGTVSLTKAFINHGKTVLGTTAGAISLASTPTWDETKSKYVFSGSGTANTKFTVTEGYIKASDFSIEAGQGTLNAENNTVTAQLTAGLSLDKAVLGLDPTVKAVIGTGITGNPVVLKDGKFVVTAKLTANKIKATVGSAGYLSAKDTQELTLSVDDADIEIQAGKKNTGITLADNTANTTWALTGAAQTDNSYKVTLPSKNIGAKTTLAEGYYSGEDLLNVTGSVNITEKTLTIDPASASITHDSTNSAITSDDLVLYSESGANMLAIKAETNCTLGVSAVTAGYLKEGTQITLPDGLHAAATKFVKKAIISQTITEGDATHILATASHTEENTVAVTFGDTTIPDSIRETPAEVLGVANTYNTKDVKISIGAHSMGSSVATKLDALAARLAGK